MCVYARTQQNKIPNSFALRFSLVLKRMPPTPLTKQKKALPRLGHIWHVACAIICRLKTSTFNRTGYVTACYI